MKSRTFLLCFSLLLIVPLFPLVYAEGGGGIECPTGSDTYSYLQGTSSYKVNSFEVGELGVLYCEYMNESPEPDDLDIFSEITAVYHFGGSVSAEIIDEYGCGSVLGEQYSPTYVSSETHFASVAFSTPALLEAASDIMTQIEDNNIATGCLVEQVEDSSKPSTVEQVKESVEEHDVIEDTAIEVSNEQINEETIETIKEQIEKSQKGDKIKITIDKPSSGILLPDWIKNNAQWWSTDQITGDDFSLGIEFMIKEGFIKVPPTEVAAEKSSEIPDWVKKNAGWWAEGAISNDEFVNGLQFLISNGIINVA